MFYSCGMLDLHLYDIARVAVYHGICRPRLIGLKFAQKF